MTSQRPFIICIAGPTASGKTELAIRICRATDGEVISMDSMQIYRNYDIGTAKPTVGEMQGICHHMLSILPPDASYTVAEYQRDAHSIMDGIILRGKLPIFVGGTGLYLHAVSHPLSFASVTGDEVIRDELLREARAPEGPEKLHARLAAVDPLSAQRIHANNTRRVIRALEVYLTTGVPVSEKHVDWEAEPEQDWMIFALTWPREVLYGRINMRVDQMMEAGLIEEVEGLLASGVPRTAQAMQAIGYKEVVAMLDGQCDKAEVIETIKRNTRRYAKRQLTWLRSDPRVIWLDGAVYNGMDALEADVLNRIGERIKERNNATD